MVTLIKTTGDVQVLGITCQDCNAFRGTLIKVDGVEGARYVAQQHGLQLNHMVSLRMEHLETYAPDVVVGY